MLVRSASVVQRAALGLVLLGLLGLGTGCKNCCCMSKDKSSTGTSSSAASGHDHSTHGAEAKKDDSANKGTVVSTPKSGAHEGHVHGSTPAPTPAPGTSTATAPSMTEVNLFDGKTLQGWKLTDFAGAGEVKVQPSFKGDQPAIVMDQGIMTGITWTNPLPRTSYEISLEAMRVSGGDFFCGLTFPVGDKHLSFIVGGWGGSVVGISSVDGEDAAHNETTKYMNFETGKWYRIKLQVRPDKVQAWINDEQMVNLVTTERVLTIRLEVEASTPLGIATWSTAGAVRNLKWSALK